jgi:hypothetical protein
MCFKTLLGQRYSLVMNANQPIGNYCKYIHMLVVGFKLNYVIDRDPC